MATHDKAHDKAGERKDAAELLDRRGAPRVDGNPLAAAFVATAGARSRAVAIERGAERIRYGELAERAAQLAARLRARGVRTGARLALSAKRTPALIVTMLAIIEAGASYVPIDPREAPERRARMLRAAGAWWLEGRESAPDLRPPADGAAPSAGSGASEARAAGESEAYVMFTSGSSGGPRGVRIPQRAILGLVRNVDYVQLGPEETILQLAPASFDAATFEIWGSLLNGGRLVLAPPDPPALGDLGRLLRHHDITTLWLTSGLFHLMAERRPEDLRPLRQLLTGGDVVAVTAARRALAAWPELRLINGYGPTEGTTFTCCHQVDWADLESGGPIPIGRAIAGRRADVLKANGTPVPVGEVGELFLGGNGVGLGYVNDDRLTAARFVPDPWAGALGARGYWSGDLARQRADGVLEFVGRRDRQLKLRGYRVAPEEVEAALLAHPQVRQAAVASAGDGEGRSLVAHLAWAGQETATVAEAELRRFLAARLPAYLCPARYAIGAALPLTARGKLDRGRLAENERTAAEHL